MLKKISLFAFVFVLAGCSSLEKIHRFKVDSKDKESQKAICNPSAEDYYEVIVVDGSQFYIEREVAPEWVGPPLIPFIPGALTERISELRLKFKRKTPENLQDWKLHFESDGFTASPKVSGTQVLFSFPARSPSEKIELIIPHQGKTTQIQLAVESSPWEYTPFFIAFGDRFPFYNCNQ